MIDLGIEKDRLGSLIDRVGIDAAVAFAKQTRLIYRKSVLNRRDPKQNDKKWCHASLPTYRRTFIESYLIFKRFIAAYDNN